MKYKNILKFTGSIIAILILISLGVPPIIVYSGKYQIYTEIKDINKTEIGIVFGAGVKPDGQPHEILEDRLTTAYDLYNADKIEKIIVSGDNRTVNYNEPTAMTNYLVELGIPEDDIVQDYAGRRTYDTCYRANAIFGVEKAILITQGYHLPRAIFLCQNMGIESYGYSATKQDYSNFSYYKAREIAALYRSIADLYIFKPEPVLGEKIDI